MAGPLRCCTALQATGRGARKAERGRRAVRGADDRKRGRGDQGARAESRLGDHRGADSARTHGRRYMDVLNKCFIHLAF